MLTKQHGIDLLWVFGGGIVGTLMRAVLVALMPVEPGQIPWSTFAVNVIGAFLLAILWGYLIGTELPPAWAQRIRLSVGVGLLGSFTTYSAFIAQIYTLQGSGAPVHALAYTVLSICVGLGSSCAGLWCARRLWSRS